MSSKPISNCFCSRGFTIEPNYIYFQARLETWATFARLMANMDSDCIPSDTDRIIFDLMRDAIINAVEAAIASSIQDEAIAANIRADLSELQIGKYN